MEGLEASGMTGKTDSSSIEADQAEKVRAYFNGGSRGGSANKPAAETKPKFDLSKVSKPGDALKPILKPTQAKAPPKPPPPRPPPAFSPPPPLPFSATP